MRLEVMSAYNTDGGYHVCRDENGGMHRVDLFVEGSISEEFKKDPDALKGKTVEVGFLAPYIEIANDGVCVVTP